MEFEFYFFCKLRNFTQILYNHLKTLKLYKLKYFLIKVDFKVLYEMSSSIRVYFK